MLFYIVSIIILNTNAVAVVFQPEANQLVFNMLGTGKFWLVLFLTPVFALIPDFLIITAQLVFKPNPDEEIMTLLNKMPNKASNEDRYPSKAVNDEQDQHVERINTFDK